MPVQASLDLQPPRPVAGRARTPRPGIGSVSLVMAASSEAADRLLERALAESGLAACEPVLLADCERLPPSHWRARSSPPRIVVLFGAEAAGRLLGRPVSLGLERGRLRPLADGSRFLVTEHPNAILRLSDPLARGREYRRLVNDLMMAVPQRRLAA